MKLQDFLFLFRVTTCLENLEIWSLRMSGKSHGKWEKSGQCEGEIVSGKIIVAILWPYNIASSWHLLQVEENVYSHACCWIYMQLSTV